MQPQTKKILNNILTTALVLGTLFGIYLFSLAARLGLVVAEVWPDLSNRFSLEASEIILSALLIILSLIVSVPLVHIIWKSPGKRWSVTRSAVLLLWPYLVFSFLVFYISIFIVTELNWLAVMDPNKQPHLLISGLVVSIGLAGSYYWYVKRIKKTLLLK